MCEKRTAGFVIGLAAAGVVGYAALAQAAPVLESTAISAAELAAVIVAVVVGVALMAAVAVVVVRAHRKGRPAFRQVTQARTARSRVTAATRRPVTTTRVRALPARKPVITEQVIEMTVLSRGEPQRSR